jgi:hypothetical protein
MATDQTRTPSDEDTHDRQLGFSGRIREHGARGDPTSSGAVGQIVKEDQRFLHRSLAGFLRRSLASVHG